MRVREIRDSDRPWLRDFIAAQWGLPVVSTSGPYDPSRLSGFVAEDDELQTMGAVTYRISEGECEVVTLNSLQENRGVGSALLARVRQLADGDGLRTWLITTNDNINAIRFYQRRGMDMRALHCDFADEVRRWKPDIDDRAGGIQFRHALEFSY